MKTKGKLVATALLGVIGGIVLIMAWHYSGFSWNLMIGLALLAGIGAVLWLPFTANRYVAIPQAVLSVFACFYLLELFTHNPWEMELMPQLLNLLVIGLLFGALASLFGSMKAGLLGIAGICLFVGLANYYTMEFRDSPILPWDLLSIRTAMSVTSNYTFSVTWREANIIIGFLLIMALALKNTVNLRKWQIRITAVILCAASLYGVKAAMGVEAITDQVLTFSNLFTQWATYRDNGFFISFMNNLKYMNIQEPEGYSREKADAIVSEGAAAYDAAHPEDASEDEIIPNVMVIMNESFSDLAVLEEFGVSQDYMPFFHELQESQQAFTGNLYVSVLGGNTANTEFEFLTGNSMAFLPAGSVAYQQYINDTLPSLASAYVSQGYAAFATHPYGASGWDRDEVYPYLGFEDAYFRPDFKNPRIIRKYVSDSSQYQFVEELMEEKSQTQPVFSFHVTMQNHGGYSQIYESFPIQVELTDIEDHEATENYLTLIRESDRALKDLISYYEACDTPTMIVFFGDHQPSDFVAKCILTSGGKDESTLTFQEQQNRYIVPYLIWANYDLEGDICETTSANFLGAVTAKESGAELTDYQKYLLNLQSKLPVITANAYMGQDGVLHPLKEAAGEDETLLEEYRMVCYRHLFDWE